MAKITGDMIIADVIRVDYDLIPVLMESGMHCVGCPSSQAETLEEASFVHGMDLDALLERLNGYLAAKNAQVEVDNAEV